MAIILSIETSTSACSVALHEKGNLVALKELHEPQMAASQLAVLTDKLFKETAITRSMVKAVAVSLGPGSYTGLRIGVATAKGICYGLNLPLIAIDSLHVLAARVIPVSATDLLCPMIDARRMEVYCCLLDTSFNRIEPTQAKIIDDSSFSNYLTTSSISFFGNGAYKCTALIRHPNAKFLENIYGSASDMGMIAFKKFQSRQFENLEMAEPNYLKEFVAKTKSPQSLL